MGIVDDYYGGYENLAMFTNFDTDEVDFEGAYLSMFDDYNDFDDFDDFGDDVSSVDGPGIQFPLGGRKRTHRGGRGGLGSKSGFGYAAGTIERLRAIIRGNFTVAELTESAEFKAAVAAHRAAQVEASAKAKEGSGAGEAAAVAYLPAKDVGLIGTPDPIYAATDLGKFNRLAGVRYDVTWWESDRARAQVDARVKFYGFEDIHLHHADVYRSIKGPQDWSWASVAASISFDRKRGRDDNFLWSTAILWKATGTCGVRKWDEGFKFLSENPQELEESDKPAHALGKKKPNKKDKKDAAPCTFFAAGKCLKGANCRFKHEGAGGSGAGAGASAAPAPCRFFLQGSCNRGTACFFSHDPALLKK